MSFSSDWRSKPTKKGIYSETSYPKRDFSELLIEKSDIIWLNKHIDYLTQKKKALNIELLQVSQELKKAKAQSDSYRKPKDNVEGGVYFTVLGADNRILVNKHKPDKSPWELRILYTPFENRTPEESMRLGLNNMLGKHFKTIKTLDSASHLYYFEQLDQNSNHVLEYQTLSVYKFKVGHFIYMTPREILKYSANNQYFIEPFLFEFIKKIEPDILNTYQSDLDLKAAPDLKVELPLENSSSSQISSDLNPMFIQQATVDIKQESKEDLQYEPEEEYEKFN